MSITKKIRFEVFKRDGFACSYCGKTPPAVTLEVDHIDPKARGGRDDINNLLTACFDCNRGKSATPLDKIPSALTENLDVLREKENQIKEYRNFVASIQKRLYRDIKSVDSIYTTYFEGYELADKFKNNSLKRFLQNLPLDVVQDAMHNACSRKIHNGDQAIRYFCGICWNKIRGTEPYGNR